MKLWGVSDADDVLCCDLIELVRELKNPNPKDDLLVGAGGLLVALEGVFEMIFVSDPFVGPIFSNCPGPFASEIFELGPSVGMYVPDVAFAFSLGVLVLLFRSTLTPGGFVLDATSPFVKLPPCTCEPSLLFSGGDDRKLNEGELTGVLLFVDIFLVRTGFTSPDVLSPIMLLVSIPYIENVIWISSYYFMLDQQLSSNETPIVWCIRNHVK